MNFDWNVTEVYSCGTNKQYIGIGSDNGSAPTRPQAISWTNGGIVYWRIYASLGLNELKTWYHETVDRYVLIDMSCISTMFVHVSKEFQNYFQWLQLSLLYSFTEY